MKVKNVADMEGNHYGVRFKCPGCGMAHVLPNQNTPPTYSGPRWTFNGNYVKPTLTPSILARGALKPGIDSEDEDWDGAAVCHSYVTDGRIQFLDDCTHKLKGQTVDLDDIVVGVSEPGSRDPRAALKDAP